MFVATFLHELMVGKANGGCDAKAQSSWVRMAVGMLSPIESGAASRLMVQRCKIVRWCAKFFLFASVLGHSVDAVICMSICVGILEGWAGVQ